MKQYLLALTIACAGFLGQVKAQTVSQTDMENIYETVKTPHKYGLVLTPDGNDKKLDCPTVFRKGKKWFMTYLVFNGRGYETWLAKSKNLLDWKPVGKLMSFTDSVNWDGSQKAGYIGLLDPKWNGSYNAKKYDGKYWMPYFGGSVAGYEAGLLSIGLASTDKDPTTIHEWQRTEKPILTSLDKDVSWWENKKQFKPTLIEDKDGKTGYKFLLYYNAVGDTADNNPKTRWFERIGVAGSNDLKTWERFYKEPVVHHRRGITGDPVFQKIGDIWVMFYFGAFWDNRLNESFNRFAASYDMVNWTDWNGDDLVKSTPGSYDEKYAHKSFVVKHKGVTYHFYCGVNKHDQRGIAVATSKDLGKSKVSFVTPDAKPAKVK